ncbi:oleosin Ara h 10.0102 [Rhodamnia argentea]|uniref:Oleosin n=1 Tax=Rhodamnia argentea TaxID=178133 RepID=A0A8B8PAM8_9MYRT|nr:oleosin Ara h 10.0102 [Rhodamnia argentea]
MADRERDRDRPHQIQVHPQHRFNGGPGGKGIMPDRGPSAGKVLAVMAMLPAGGILLGLAGITFVGTIIGLCLATPVFILFSPVLVPAALVVGLAVAGFLTSGAFGLTALSSLSRVANYIRQATGTSPEQMAEHAKRRLADTAGFMGQKTKEAGQQVQSKAQEAGGERGGGGART